jgi:hypothetical protein
MTNSFQSVNNRREKQRYKINVPLTVLIKRHKIPGFTQNMSNQGVFFYLASADSAKIPTDFEFLVELPPEITLSTGCSIRCQGRMVRIESLPGQLTGIAAKILHYSIQRSATTNS